MRNRSSFVIVKVADRIVYIMDNDDGSLSVTNDAERVCREIAALYPGHRIVYRDTMGRWDELVHHEGRFLRFQHHKRKMS